MLYRMHRLPWRSSCPRSGSSNSPRGEAYSLTARARWSLLFPLGGKKKSYMPAILANDSNTSRQIERTVSLGRVHSGFQYMPGDMTT